MKPPILNPRDRYHLALDLNWCNQHPDAPVPFRVARSHPSKREIALAVLMFACMFACALVWWFALGGG